MAQTEEVKLLLSAEDKASREVERLMGKLKTFQSRMSKSFDTPFSSKNLNTAAVTEAFKKYGDGLSQIHERHTRWAHNERRMGRMTHDTWDSLNKQLDSYINKDGTVRKLRGKQIDQFVDLTRKVRAFEGVWGRQHERYLSGLQREQVIKDQVERAKDRLGALGFQNESRRRKSMNTAAAALDKQRSAAYVKSLRDQATSVISLERQRSAAFLAEGRSQDSAKRALERQRSMAFVAQLRGEANAEQALNRQRTTAFLAEERRKQQLKINSYRMMMRQDEAARKAEDRAAAQQERQRHQVMGRGAQAAQSIPGNIQSVAGTVALYSGIAAAAVAKMAHSGIGARSRADTAEGNLQMFGGMSRPDITAARKEWINSAAVDNGFTPAAAINAFTESIKAGIPESASKDVTKSIMGASAGLDLDVAATTKLVGRLSTLTQDPKDFKSGEIDKMLNGIAVVAKTTAADSNELVSSLRRGAGALGSSKMSVNDLTAFTGTAISTGMQEGKAGTFMDFQINELVNAKNSRGQRRKDLEKGSQLAGLGSLSQVSRQAANDPTKLLQKLYGNMAKMTPEKAGQVATLMGMREWRGEMLMMVKGIETLNKTLIQVNDPANDNHLAQAKEIKLGTIDGMFRQLRAVSALIWEAVGLGLEDPLREIGNFFLNFQKGVNLDVIQAHVKTLVDGFVDGLGFNSVTEVLQSIFGKPGDFSFATVDSFFKFAQGFGKGVRDVITFIKGLIPAGGISPATLGEWTAKIAGFSLAIAAMGPAITILTTLASTIGALGLALMGIQGALALVSTFLGGGAAAGAAAGAGGAAAGAGGAAGLAGGAAALAGILGTVLSGAVVAVSIVGITSAVAYALFGKEGVKATSTALSGGGLTKGDQDKMVNRLGKWAQARNPATAPTIPPASNFDVIPTVPGFPGVPQIRVPPALAPTPPAPAPTPNPPEGFWNRLFQRQSFNDPETTGSLKDLIQNASYSGDAYKVSAPARNARDSFNEPQREGSVRGLVQDASYSAGYRDNDGLDRLNASIQNMGARFQLAALGSGGLGSGASSSFGGGGGGGGGGSGGSSFNGGSNDPATKQFGKNFFTPEGSDGGKIGPYAGSQNFKSMAPRISADLQKDFPGLGKQDTAAILGNLGHESAGMTAFQEGNPRGGGRGGWGWAQWTGPRRKQFEAYAAEKGLDPKSYEANYGFLRKELKGGYKGSLEAMKGQNTLEGKTMAFEKSYEAAGVKHYGSRFKYAREAMGLPDGVSGNGDAPAGSVNASMDTVSGAGGAADVASKFIGKNENRDRKELSSFMGHDVAGNLNAWCARFVNSSLEAAGTKGTGSAMANSFLRWGKGVDAESVQKGDVAVEHRNKGVDAGGGHVGVATGEKRINPRTGRLEIETISGNHGDEVVKDWTDASKLAIRRDTNAAAKKAVEAVKGTAAAAAQANAVRVPRQPISLDAPGGGDNPGGWTRAGGNAEALGSRVPQKKSPDEMIQRVPEGQRRAPAGSTMAGGGGNTTHITQNIHGGVNNPQQIANLAQRKITEDWNHRAHDLEPELS